MVDTVFADNKDKPEKQKPMTFEQACNYLDELKSLDMKDEAKKAEMTISTASVEDMRRFLMYAVSLIDRKKYPAQRKLLEVRVMGMSVDEIARSFKVSSETVIRLEKDALSVAMDAIRSKRDGAIPILNIVS